jgi:hypothetical protein
MSQEPTAQTALHIGDTIHVRKDGRAYMRVQVERIADGTVEALVTWATIIALTYRCQLDQVVWERDRWAVNHDAPIVQKMPPS